MRCTLELDEAVQLGLEVGDGHLNAPYQSCDQNLLGRPPCACRRMQLLGQPGILLSALIFHCHRVLRGIRHPREGFRRRA